jgi:hypothetical protein
VRGFSLDAWVWLVDIWRGSSFAPEASGFYDERSFVYFMRDDDILYNMLWNVLI